jgi:DNA-binding CsgD family transcriptional regulator
MADHALTRDEADERADTIELELEQLIKRLIENDARPGFDGKADEIILDIEVDGVRYLAIRCVTHPAPSAERAQRTEPVVVPPHAGAALSPREFEIARMVAKGYANKTIASVLGISSWTVSSHLRRSFSKLGVTSRAALVAQLLDDGQRWRPTPPALRTAADLADLHVSATADVRPEDASAAKEGDPISHIVSRGVVLGDGGH